MIERATAIPLAIFPYSTTSRIVHWLTRHQGKVSTVLKGALRPKSPFLGEYELFCTSELLYYSKHAYSLHTAKECALLNNRYLFRHDWRAMQTASYLTTLVNKTTPEETPTPELFEFFETLLDWAEAYGAHPQFLLWSELQFCDFHGHTPNLGNCTVCSSTKDLRFCASQGGVVCATCAREKKLPILECTPDVLAILRAWQTTEQPSRIVNTQLTGKQRTDLNKICGAFMHDQFNLQPQHREAAHQAA
jgi:DNA repair protein RecO (recombination protein O)